MHSSGMRTARLLTVSQHALPGGYLPRGVYLLWGVPASGVPTLGCTCLGGVPAQGCTCPGGTYPGVPAEGTCLGGTCWGAYLPRGCTCWRCTCKGVLAWVGVYLPGRGVYLPRSSPLWTDRYV